LEKTLRKQKKEKKSDFFSVTELLPKRGKGTVGSAEEIKGKLCF